MVQEKYPYGSSSGGSKEAANRILGRKYVRPILEGLEREPSGMSFRAIDVKIIGERGSPASGSKTLRKLLDVGWIDNLDGVYVITEKGHKALNYARQGDALANVEKKGI